MQLLYLKCFNLRNTNGNISKLIQPSYMLPRKFDYRYSQCLCNHCHTNHILTIPGCGNSQKYISLFSISQKLLGENSFAIFIV